MKFAILFMSLFEWIPGNAWSLIRDRSSAFDTSINLHLHPSFILPRRTDDSSILLVSWNWQDASSTW